MRVRVRCDTLPTYLVDAASRMQVTRNGVLLAAALLMAATAPSGCSKLFEPIGGTTSGALDGYYQGTFTDNINGGTGNAIALVTESGHAKIELQFSGGGVAIFDALGVTLSNGSFNVPYTRYTSVTGSTATRGTVTGTLVGNQTLNASFSATAPVDSGTLSLNFGAQQYQQAASLALVAGTYSMSYVDARGVTVTGSIGVSSQGNFSGSDTDGCHYSGQLGVPDGSRNLYTGALIFTCGQNVIDYDVLGTYFNGATANTVSQFQLLVTDAANQQTPTLATTVPPAAQQLNLQR